MIHTVEPKSFQSQQQGNILLVDDLPENLQLLSEALRQNGYEVRSAINATLALMSIQVELPDLILLDVSMPDINGFEFCAQLKSDPAFSEIPVIFVSALGEVPDKIQAFDQGGVDYITKPFQIDEVLVRVKHQLKLVQLKRELEEQNQTLVQLTAQQRLQEAKILALNEELESKVAQRTQELQRAIIQLHEEMNERQEAQERSIKVAYYDQLTGLPNQASLINHLNHLLEHSRLHRREDQRDTVLTLIIIQFDQLQSIIEALGHRSGDLLCRTIANRLVAVLPEDCFISRNGHGNFGLVISNNPSTKDVQVYLNTIIKAFQDPLPVGQYQVFAKPLMGVAQASHERESADHIIRDADLALSCARQQQAPAWAMFNPEMHQSSLDKFTLGIDLHMAIQRKELEVHYQPIFDIVEHQVIGFEALLRWKHSERGWISPGQFIPIAEESGSIVAIGEWTLREACQQLVQWNQMWPDQPRFMSVNLSCIQFKTPNLVDSFAQVLKETGIDGKHLKLEVTESTVMSNSEDAIAILETFRSQGIQISIDDFGTGYSSLSYLQKLPVNTLKIDRAFIDQMETDQDKRQIVKSIIGLAQTLQLDIIAEGIETQEQLFLLPQMGCIQAQGYYLGKPMNAEKVEEFLKDS